MKGPPSRPPEADDAEKPRASKTRNPLRALPPLDTSDWPDVLIGPTPRSILVRLIEGDPLGLSARCEKYLREQHFLVDVRRLNERTAAVMAFRAARDGPGGTVVQFISESIETSTKQLLEQDREDDRAKAPIDDPDESRYQFITNVLGVYPHLTRRAAVVFNGLPSSVRASFWAVVIEGKSPRRAASDGLGRRKRIEKEVERAFRAISLFRDPKEPKLPGEDHD